MRNPRQETALLCSSGLGTRGGGVGVVAEFLHRALSQRYRVVHLEYRSNQSWRSRLSFAAELAREQWSQHALQVFSHIDLMRSLGLTPRPNLPTGKHSRDVLFVHGIEVWRALDAPRKRALQHATVLSNSDYTQQRLREFHPMPGAIKTVHLAVDFPPEPTREAIIAAQAKVPTVAIVGRMNRAERYKGHDQLIEAWPEVMRALPGAQLLCIGGGDDVVRLEAKALTLNARVRFLQGLTDPQRSAQVQSAHLFAFPSTGEGFGLAAIEAACVGVPVLGLRNAVLAEIIPEPKGSILIDRQDASEIASAIIPALQDQAATRSAGLASMAHVRAHFAPEHFYARFWQAIDPLSKAGNT